MRTRVSIVVSIVTLVSLASLWLISAVPSERAVQRRARWLAEGPWRVTTLSLDPAAQRRYPDLMVRLRREKDKATLELRLSSEHPWYDKLLGARLRQFVYFRYCPNPTAYPRGAVVDVRNRLDSLAVNYLVLDFRAFPRVSTKVNPFSLVAHQWPLTVSLQRALR